METKKHGRFMAVLLSLVMCLTLLPMAAFAGGEVTNVDITMSEPQPGQICGDVNSTVGVPRGAGYTASVTGWNDDSGRSGDSVSVDTAISRKYTVKINVTAGDGFTFSNHVTASINGAAATIVEFAADHISLSRTFTLPPEQVTVTFDSNGGSGTMASVTMDKGASYILPANGFTAPAGKEFSAWDVNGAEKAAGDSVEVTANMAVKAVWKDKPVEKVTITFDANGGGGTMEPVTINKGGYYILPQNGFTKPEGADVFMYWSVDGKGEMEGCYIYPDHDVVAKAIWRYETRTKISRVEGTSNAKTLIVNGGTVDDISFEIEKIEDEEPLSYGGTFWRTAVWYKVWGGKRHEYEGREFTEGVYQYGVNFKVWGDYRHRYVFDRNGVEVVIDGVPWEVIDVNVSNSDDDSRVFAMSPEFEVKGNRTVTFDSDGGSQVPAQTVIRDEKATEPQPPTKKGFIFGGWTLNGEKYDFNTPVTQNITLVANWKAPTSVITVDPNGGKWRDGTTAAKTYTVDVGKDFTLPPPPSKEGYDFQYYKGSRLKPGDKYTVTAEDHTFTAQWKKKEKPTVTPVTPAAPPEPKNTAVSTGDDTMIGLYISLAAVSLGGVIFFKKKRNTANR
jgi:uncharacterized repeat protein (TIGR02543 family)/LPXTG-motif cell wall-anchored protein